MRSAPLLVAAAAAWAVGVAGAEGVGQPLARANIDPVHVIVAGCSHAADFAHQFHIAYSSMVTGACVFSGQPYRCAITRFTGDVQVEQTPESSVPRCDGCDANKTLVYDHCKNHPSWVDVGMLPDYIRRGCGQNPIVKQNCIDDPANIKNARVWLFHPTHDRCYLPGAVANVQALYSQLLEDPGETLKFVNDQPFPHCLPTNSTPHFNSSVPAMYDGPGECLRWTMPSVSYAGTPDPSNVVVFDQTEFITRYNLSGTGGAPFGAVYLPQRCANGTSVQCKLLIIPNGCKGAGSDASKLFSGTDYDWAAYGEANDIVVLKPCVGGDLDAERFPNAAEVQRGLLDVYGQMSEDYALQSGQHMQLIGSIVRRLMYGE